VVGARKAQRPVRLEREAADLDLSLRPDRLHHPSARGPALVSGVDRSRCQFISRRRAEPVAAIPPAAHGGETAVPLRSEACLEFGILAVVDEPLSVEQAKIGGVEALQLDRAGEGAAAERPRSAAARAADDV